MKLIKNISENTTLCFSLYIAFCIFLFIASLFMAANFIPTDENYCSILLAIAGVAGTISPITSAFILFYIEKVSSEYSIKFLSHAKRNLIYIFFTTFTIILIVLSIIFSANERFPFDFQIIFSFFTVFMISLLASIIETIRIINPVNGILKPEKHRICKLIDKKFFDYEKKNKILMDTGTGFFNTPPEFNSGNLFESELIPIRDVILKAITKNSLQEASDGVQVLSEIFIHYLGKRSQYRNDNDKFIYFAYTEFGIIQEAAMKTGYFHLRLHPILIQCWKKISVAATKVKVGLPGYTSLNGILHFPTEAIKILVVTNLQHENSSTPMLGCIALENMAFNLIDNDYPWQAQNICDALAIISSIGIKFNGCNFISLRANQAIMNISYKALLNREKFLGKEHLYYSLQEMFRGSLSKPFIETIKNEDTLRSYQPSAAVLCHLYDFQRSVTMPHIMTAILSYQKTPDLHNSIETIKTINRSILYPTAYELSKSANRLLTEEYVDTIYICSMIILSTINTKLGFEIKPNYKKLKLPENIVTSLIAAHIDMLLILSNGKERRSYCSDKTLDAIFSILIICLYTKDKTLNNFAISKIKSLISKYKEKEYSPNDTFFLYCRLFEKAAKINGLKIPKYKMKNDPERYIYQYHDAKKEYPTNYDMIIQRGEFQWELLGTQELGIKFLHDTNKKIWSKK